MRFKAIKVKEGERTYGKLTVELFNPAVRVSRVNQMGLPVGPGLTFKSKQEVKEMIQVLQELEKNWED